MKYSVLVTPTAQEEIREAFAYIHGDAPLNAQRWLTRLYEKIDTLELFPNRCAIAPDGSPRRPPGYGGIHARGPGGIVMVPCRWRYNWQQSIGS